MRTQVCRSRRFQTFEQDRAMTSSDQSLGGIQHPRSRSIRPGRPATRVRCRMLGSTSGPSDSQTRRHGLPHRSRVANVHQGRFDLEIAIAHESLLRRWGRALITGPPRRERCRGCPGSPTTSAIVWPTHICFERSQVHEARAPDVVAVGGPGAVGDDVEAEFPLRVLDARVGLARRGLDQVGFFPGQDRAGPADLSRRLASGSSEALADLVRGGRGSGRKRRRATR